MAGRGRNEVCGCGSGRKVKRCCGVARGPGPEDLARAFLAEQRRAAARRLSRITRDEFHELFAAMLELPVHDVSMQLRLPRLLTPELEALRTAIGDDDEAAVEARVGPALALIDKAERRAELARAVLWLADAGRIDPRLAAVAMIDLTTRSSALLQSSLLESLAVSVGAARTPAGLVVVSG